MDTSQTAICSECGAVAIEAVETPYGMVILCDQCLADDDQEED